MLPAAKRVWITVLTPLKTVGTLGKLKKYGTFFKFQLPEPFQGQSNDPHFCMRSLDNG